MKSREQIAAQNLRIAAVGYAAKRGDRALERKLQKAAVEFAEWKAHLDVFTAALKLGAINAHESDRAMRGYEAREKPPGLTKAIERLRHAEKKKLEVSGAYGVVRTSLTKKRP